MTSRPWQGGGECQKIFIRQYKIVALNITYNLVKSLMNNPLHEFHFQRCIFYNPAVIFTLYFLQMQFFRCNIFSGVHFLIVTLTSFYDFYNFLVYFYYKITLSFLHCYFVHCWEKLCCNKSSIKVQKNPATIFSFFLIRKKMFLKSSNH